MEIKVRECEMADYVLRVDVSNAVGRLKQRYPNFISAIDEAFGGVV